MAVHTALLVRLSADDKKIHARCSYDPHVKEVLKAVPGARWNTATRTWIYPASPAVADRLNEELCEAGCQVHTDDKVRFLLESAEVIKGASYTKEAQIEDLPQPEIRKTDAWLHQLRGFHFARSIPACMLAMDMGTGKSKVAIDLIQQSKGNNRYRALIICPKSVLSVWPHEFQKRGAWDALRIKILDKGTTEKKAKELKRDLDAPAPLVVVLNYESAWRGNLAVKLLDVEWDMVILDESHRIKSPGGKASRFCGLLSKMAQKRVCLTGTPLPHSPLDAYGQYRFLDPGIFGTSFTQFRARYAVMGGFQNRQVTGYQREAEFNRRFYSIAYRVGKEVLDLPPVMEIERRVELEPKTARTYRELESHFVASIDAGLVTVSNALTKLLRLQQVTSGYVKTDEGELIQVGTEKQDLLADVLEDIPEPVVVFCRFKADLDSVHSVAESLGRPSFELSGRKNELHEWKKSGDLAPMIAVQIQAGGVGVDLTKAQYCVYYSLGFSLGDYEQSRARVHRPGQERTTFYIHLLADNTVDEKVYKALADRKDVVENILGGTWK